MATVTYPGVYVFEKKGGPSPIQGVSASTLGIAGWTTKGPDHVATLISSWGQFVDKFGNFTSDSLVPTTLYSFFRNGGSKAYVVRTTPSDAIDSYLYIKNPDISENIETGNGVLTAFTGSLSGESVPASLAITYYGTDVVVTDEEIEDGTESDGIIAIWKTSGAGAGQGTIALPLNLPIRPGSATISWIDSADAAMSQTDNGSGVFTGDGLPASSTINYVTGAITLNTTGDLVKTGTTILIDYTSLEVKTITDDGEGALIGAVDGAGVNTIDYDTGAYSFKTTSAPPLHATLGIVASTFDESLWKLTMQWPGIAGDNFRVRIKGNPNNEIKGTGTWTTYDFYIDEYDSDKSVWRQREFFESCNFGDSTSTSYFSLKVNDDNAGSKLLTITTPSFDDSVPTTLTGTPVLAELLDTATSATQYTGTLVGVTCVKYSLSITTTADSDSSTLTITDDGSGNLIGDVSTSGTNTIDYTTGEFDFTLSEAPTVGANIDADYVIQPTETTHTIQMTSGDDGSSITSANVTGASLEAGKQGIYAFNNVQDNLLMVLPDFAGDSTVDGALVDFCVEKQDRFAILTTPLGMDPQSAVNYKQNTLSKVTSFAAMYWPWVKIIDPVTSKSATIPPIGHVAGIYAKTIQNKNVSKAPAGKEDGQLAYFIGLEYDTLDSEVGTTNPVGINAIIKRPQIGTAVWGARTLDVDSEYRYVQSRLLAMFLRKSLYNATHWVVFENNGSELWTRIKLQVDSFMRNLYRNKYFAGNSPEEAYYVIVDSTNNPQDSIDAGYVNVDVGFAPQKPAEFVVFNLAQKTLSS